MTKVPQQRPDAARARVDIAQLTAKADLVLSELTDVIEQMAALLRQGATAPQEAPK